MGGPVEGVEGQGRSRDQGRLKRGGAVGPGWETGRGRSWEEGHRVWWTGQPVGSPNGGRAGHEGSQTAGTDKDFLEKGVNFLKRFQLKSKC